MAKNKNTQRIEVPEFEDYTRNFKADHFRVTATDKGVALFIGVKQNVYTSGIATRQDLVKLHEWLGELLADTAEVDKMEQTR